MSAKRLQTDARPKQKESILNSIRRDILQILTYPSYADAARTSHFPNEEERLHDAPKE